MTSSSSSIFSYHAPRNAYVSSLTWHQGVTSEYPDMLTSSQHRLVTSIAILICRIISIFKTLTRLLLNQYLFLQDYIVISNSIKRQHRTHFTSFTSRTATVTSTSTTCRKQRYGRTSKFGKNIGTLSQSASSATTIRATVFVTNRLVLTVQNVER